MRTIRDNQGVNRRTALGIVAAAGAFTSRHAQAQQPLRTVGISFSGPATDTGSRANIDAFKDEMTRLGWIEERSIRYVYAWGENDAATARAAAERIRAESPDVILTSGTVATTAFHQVVKTIPIVFANVTDPVAGGFVASLAEPGGLVTGFTPFDYDIGGKWLEQLLAVAPKLSRVALMGDPANHNYQGFIASFRQAASRHKVEPLEAPVREAADIDSVIDRLGRETGAGLIVSAATFSLAHRKRIIDGCAAARLPAIYWWRNFVVTGGLMSYGPNGEKMHRQAARYVDRVLKGASPATLPVQRAETFETVLNAGTARAIGLSITPTQLALMDDVIE